MRATCRATKRNGDPCRSTAVLASGFCTAHDEAYRESRSEQSAKGGRHKSNRERAARNLPDDLRGVGERLLNAMQDLIDGKLDPKKATALASLANAYRGVFETGTLSAKLDAIDERLQAAEKGDGR
jgi:hypothetical protein